MGEVSTAGILEEEITLNLRRKRESEFAGETVLIRMFEDRMNDALQRYSDMLRFMAGSSLEAPAYGA